MTHHCDPAAVGRVMHASAQAWADLQSTAQIFQANVNRRDFDAAELERLRLHTLIDDYVDHYLVAGRMCSE